jgi:transcription-repair coupling factor (superfamily II helicase)
VNLLAREFQQLKEFNILSDDIKKAQFPICISNISGSQKAHMIYSLHTVFDKPCLIIADNEIEAQKVFEDISHFLPKKTALFPAREVVFFDVDAISKEMVARRLDVLEKVLRGEKLVVVTTFEALMQRLPPKQLFEKSAIELKVNQEVKMEELLHSLVIGGYERVDVVDAHGQFASRGGIVDFSPFLGDCAYRIEFFGDFIDSIRSVDIVTQRSLDMLDCISIFPASETIISSDEIENIIHRIQTEADSTKNEQLIHKVVGDIEKLRETAKIKNIDRYFSKFYPEWSTLLDFISKKSFVVLDEPKRAIERGRASYEEFSQTYKSLLEKNIVLPSSFEVICSSDAILKEIEKLNLISLVSISLDDKISYGENIKFNAKEIGGFVNFEALVQRTNEFKSKDYKVVIFAGNKLTAERTNQELRERNIESIYVQSLEKSSIQLGQVVVSHGTLSTSFEYPDIKLAVLSDLELFGYDKKKNKPKRRKLNINFTDLNIGDYVVHATHGIGQYIGIEKLVVEGNAKDYLKIRYFNDDMLYIPTTQMEVIQKYIGSEGKTPRINKLGGTEWGKIKKRVKESLIDIAKELIAIYAQRQATKGHVFSKDTIWQKQFEEHFPYQETEDQLTCIQEVKTDMEKEKVMDRLLCGDVGFGKTEVAIRAAFKAAIDGKQVAYLVPTTILAKQHYDTFAARMKNFPINVEMLSRFRTASEQKKIVKALKEGNVDIIIGTHRILQKDIHFKNLGLLIIDEEQRFGVSNKEKIKQMKANVDVLTLTATPIPRTLHMAMVGIRDMSVLYEPPEDRHPVQTFVMEYDAGVIKDAIIREINRGGQVYYLSNRVDSIYKVASKIQELVPESSVAVAHGQMDSNQLEDIMFNFIQGKWNVLVCTTIIESGLDIPNVNTIIIEDADKMGLSQLYQIRGRVGRSNRLAYAYITYNRNKVLSEIAEKRLKAISDFTEFGSGFRIAMRDLEIRGAGNLLGAQQHGHMEAVGYDTYCRLLDEAVKELNGEEIKEEIDIQIDIDVSAYISSDYIPSENQKIEMYKKIASAYDEKDVEDIIDELIDRYGEIPKEVEHLITIVKIKLLAKQCGVIAIMEKNGMILFQMDENSLKIEMLGKLMNHFKGKLFFTASTPPYISYKMTEKSTKKLENIKNLLQIFNNIQNEG